MKETKIYEWMFDVAYIRNFECFNEAYIRNLIKVDIWFKCWKKRGNKPKNIWVAKQEPVVPMYISMLFQCNWKLLHIIIIV